MRCTDLSDGCVSCCAFARVRHTTPKRATLSALRTPLKLFCQFRTISPPEKLRLFPVFLLLDAVEHALGCVYDPQLAAIGLPGRIPVSERAWSRRIFVPPAQGFELQQARRV